MDGNGKESRLVLKKQEAFYIIEYKANSEPL